MECCPASKKKEILIGATTYMNLEDITLNEISQPPKDKYWMIHFYEVPRIVKLRQKVE